ncbi:Alpha/Beta hydrolase protein [Leptodontidium sp. 2 PMI_412]|nr:Alpha/Beta hydrolase protein [Leptodontidium sp. 2 PMI_412]
MASRSSKPGLSLREKLSFFKSILLIPTTIPLVVLRYFIFPPANSPGVKRAVVQHLLKSILSIPIQQKMVYLPAPSTGSSVIKFCSQASPPLNHKLELLSHDTRLHIIGPTIDPATQPNILLFFHGGSYFHSAAPSHVPFAYACSQSYSTPGSTTILAVLEYTLSPLAPYPKQLRQAIAALNHILTLTSASNIVLVGDSAGGHLAASLSSHVLHPNTDTDTGLETVHLKENSKLRGLCLVSPALSFDLTTESYTTNSSTDYLSSDSVNDMIVNFTPPSLALADAIKNPQLSPGDAPATHWSHLPVSKILLAVGEREVLYSSCVAFAEKLKQAGASVKLVVGEGEWHDAPIVDVIFGMEEMVGGTRRAVMDWMREMAYLELDV